MTPIRPEDPVIPTTCHRLPPEPEQGVTEKDAPVPVPKCRRRRGAQQHSNTFMGLSAQKTRKLMRPTNADLLPPRRRSSRSPKQWRRYLRKTVRSALLLSSMQYANTAVDLDEGGRKLVYHNAIQGPNKEQWERAGGEEIIRLFESLTGRLIRINDIPKGRKATYYNPRCRIKMKNGELQYRVRGTAGGDRVEYDGETAAFTASMQTLKILLNAVVSDQNARFATVDIKDYYLGTPLLDKHRIHAH